MLLFFCPGHAFAGWQEDIRQNHQIAIDCMYNLMEYPNIPRPNTPENGWKAKRTLDEYIRRWKELKDQQRYAGKFKYRFSGSGLTIADGDVIHL